MASTLFIGDAVNLVGQRFPKLLTEGNGARLSDEVVKFMWLRYPWRASIGVLPPFGLNLSEPDYTLPFVSIPGDFLNLHQVWIRAWDGTKIEPQLTIKPDLPISVTEGPPESISYQPELSGFRIFPRPSMISPDYWIEGRYKKQLTKIVNATLQTYAFPWDDQYFHVFRKGLVAKVKDELLNNKQEALAEYGEFLNLLEGMAAAENLISGENSVHPQFPLAMGG